MNSIPLNPVRAGLVEVGALRDYAWSSYPKFFAEEPPIGLVRERLLAALKFPDTPAGMLRYAERLELAEEANPTARDELARRDCRGWAVASREYREELTIAFRKLGDERALTGSDWAEVREHAWNVRPGELLTAAGRTRDEAAREAKAGGWKVRIAARLRAETTATNAWIARELGMGHPRRVGNLVRGMQE